MYTEEERKRNELRKEKNKTIKIKPHLRQFFKVVKIGPTPRLNAVKFWEPKKSTGFEQIDDAEKN